MDEWMRVLLKNFHWLRELEEQDVLVDSNIHTKINKSID
jgi:hypothetical protein